MTKTATKRKVKMPGKIRQRLSAALCMLLVSAIMMVSSTYAWFTLSTAPEVKGIDTSIAGNGSLEIALVPSTGVLSEITSGRGTSGTNGGGTVAVSTANKSWGNLVTLNDASYGFGDLTLRPIETTITVNPEVENVVQADTIAFAVPEFGYDGRISALNSANVKLKSFDASAFTAEDTAANPHKGVRAIVDAEGDTYGYVVDLAFRINTTNSDGTPAKLRLQQEGIQRIYNGQDEYEGIMPNTQGAGSYMRFENNVLGSNLKDAVRIAFVQDFGVAGGTPKLLAYAKVNDNNGTLQLYTEVKNTTTDPDTQQQVTTITQTDVTNNVLLAAMNKNTAYQISVIVWLDGATVKNSDLAISPSALNTATLNLQFSTDVDLVPAINTDLRDNPPAATTPENNSQGGGDNQTPATPAVTASKDEISVAVGESDTFTLTVPDGVTVGTVVSSEDGTATVTESDGTYTVTGVAAGNTSIIVNYTPDGGEATMIEIPVTVTESEP